MVGGMESVKKLLIDNARNFYGDISPCSGIESFSECFTEIDDGENIVFWFNTPDNSTHMLSSRNLRGIYISD